MAFCDGRLEAATVRPCGYSLCCCSWRWLRLVHADFWIVVAEGGGDNLAGMEMGLEGE